MRIYWDTNLFIYQFEDHGDLSRMTAALWERMGAHGATLLTSVLTLGELLAGPASGGDLTAAVPLEHLLRETATLIAFDEAAALRFARIRADRSIRPPDAIHLACAAAAGADIFVTNDARLSRKIVPGVPIMSSLAAVPI